MLYAVLLFWKEKEYNASLNPREDYIYLLESLSVLYSKKNMSAERPTKSPLEISGSTEGEETKPIVISANDKGLAWMDHLEEVFGAPYIKVEGDNEAPQQIFRARWRSEMSGVGIAHHLSISRNPRDEHRHFSVDITEMPGGELQDVLFSANVRHITVIPHEETVLFREQMQNGTELGVIVYRNGRFTKE